MSINTAPTDLSKFALVNLDVHSWTGRKKMEDGDIEGKVPPKKLASLGTKAIIDPSKIKIFDTLKRKAERRIRSVGIKIMGCTAVPLHQIPTLKKDLEEIQDEYYQAKADFVQGYHQDITEWIEQAKNDPDGDWSHILVQAITPEHYLKKQIQFGWQSFKISQADDDFDGMNTALDSMAEKLFEDIREDGRSIYEKSFFMKTSVLQKAIGPLKAIQKKLHGLAFLDGRAFAISDIMSKVINLCPTEGRIEGEHLARIQSLLYMISDSDRIKQFGEDVSNGVIDCDSLVEGDLKVVSAPVQLQQSHQNPKANSNANNKADDEEKENQKEPASKKDDLEVDDSWF